MAKADVKLVFGHRLRQLRTSRGMSQERLAQLVGLDRSYIGGVERGERNISLENIHKLGRGLGIPMRELMDFDHG
jgi:transcriptional regulator with XRE-family HTH domain